MYKESLVAKHSRRSRQLEGGGTTIPGPRRQRRARSNIHTAHHTHTEEEKSPHNEVAVMKSRETRTNRPSALDENITIALSCPGASAMMNIGLMS